jgi:hypothetical protein
MEELPTGEERGGQLKAAKKSTFLGNYHVMWNKVPHNYKLA